MSQSETPQTAGSKRQVQIKQSQVPRMGLKEALRIAEAIRDNYGLEPSTPVDVGVAIGIAPTSGGFRLIAGASAAYGITTGGYKSDFITLTELGKRIVAPTEEGDDLVAMRQAFETPAVIAAFIQKYNGSKLPTSDAVVENVLHTMGVPRDRAAGVYEQILEGLETLGYLRLLNDAKFLQRPSGTTPVANLVDPPEGPDDATPPRDAEPGAAADEMSGHGRVESSGGGITGQDRPNAIFVGHGRNRKPLEQLVKILDEYGIPHKEAVAEPNSGRPIPTKVADTMRQCGAAILIFSADEQLSDVDGNEVWRPSENVVYELGAASVLYEDRIIIFKEESVSLASNFSSIGHISFEKDKLSDKAVDLFRELVSFKVISVSVRG